MPEETKQVSNNIHLRESGRMTKELKIQLTTFKGHRGVDIRWYLESPEYTGASNKGIWIPIAQWEDFKKRINDLVV